MEPASILFFKNRSDKYLSAVVWLKLAVSWQDRADTGTGLPPRDQNSSVRDEQCGIENPITSIGNGRNI